MYKERIVERNDRITAHADKLASFLQIADFLYKNLGLIAEVHSRIKGDNVTYELHLIDRPSTSVQIQKTFKEGGLQTDWEVIDLSN